MKHGPGSVHRVLDFLLAQTAPVTRPQIATACGVSRPTAFAAVQDLQQRGLVREAGLQGGSLGRSATLYELAPEAGVLAAVDIGGSNLRAAITDLRGQTVTELHVPTTSRGGPAVVAQALELLEKAVEASGPAVSPLSHLAVSVPGVVGADGRTVSHASNIDQFDAFDFGSRFASHLGIPVNLENNVNLAALAERWIGTARDLQTFVVVAVGAGIGAGVVHAGQLLRGAHGAAGEVAFLAAPSNGTGPVRGHDVAGGLSLLEAARLRTDWHGGPPSTVEELFARAEADEGPAAIIVEEECNRIVAVLASVCAVIDPEAVILTGGVGGNERLIERVGSLAASMVPFPPAVMRSQLGERASLVGAIYLATQAAKADLLAALHD